jgi:hypothetical protein
VFKKIEKFKIFSLTVLLFGVAPASHAVDSIAFEAGTGDKIRMARVGVQWKWAQQWWRSNGTHIGGYWDLNLGRWQGDRYQNVPGRKQNITTIGLTPVFRFQNDTLKGFYLEGGIGANYLSELYDNNDDKLSTRFQFGDHLGIGYVFSNNLDLGLKVQHYSNGGIKKPNSGVDFAVISVRYAF